ncbi:MAG: DUF6398 domain-containing protein [Nitriliruptoraceae bacterium]
MDDEPDLLSDVRGTLRESHPLSLLATASSLLAVTAPREGDPMAAVHGDPGEGPDRDQLIASFLEVRRPETSALLTAIAELIDDELTTHRIARELAARSHKPPRWLRRLTPLRVERAVEMAHILGDGDNILLGVRTGTDHHLTVVIYIDHNMGTVVKDAFVVPEPLASLHDRFTELAADEPDTTFTELDPAEARTRITQAIELGAITYPPFETDTWPACRPLVEWVVRHLPEGGTGYVRPDWSEEDRAALVDRFLDSGYLEVDDIEAAEDLAHVFVWFACDYGPGDPLRWSQVSVEILLTDFLHRKAILPDETMRLAPDVLRGFVRFAHAERGIRSQLTDDTLASIDRDAETYLQLIDADPPEHGIPFPFGLVMRRSLIDDVGTEEALESLTTEPLPDEPLDLSRVPEDVHERVARIAARLDACCDELLDVEHRTACRRLLADVAAGDPAIFRRRSRDDTTAAAIAWVVGKANDSVASPGSDLTAKTLLAWFGVSGSVSQRADPMLRAIGAPASGGGMIYLGTPRYLVSSKREQIADLRERWR